MEQRYTVAGMQFPAINPLCIPVKVNADVAAAVSSVISVGPYCTKMFSKKKKKSHKLYICFFLMSQLSSVNV